MPGSPNRNATANDYGFRWDTTYTDLPGDFFSRVEPTPVAKPSLAVFNDGLARELGLDADALRSPGGVALLAGNATPPGGTPIAQAYAGHQFGNFTMLGDGRAILLGQHRTPNGRRIDLQLKGPGRTPYSRGGDGRAALGPMLREFLVSEAMHALGVPTTRALAVVHTGEAVQRETALPGAILTRVAPHHVRVGTFEFAAQYLGPDAVRALAEHVMPAECAEAERPARAFFEHVCDQQVELIAKWLAIGFVHGVMNTDNTVVGDFTIDYGPCAFLDAYDPATVFSSIDQFGRYAYANQPGIVAWNLARFAEALLPLLDDDAQAAVAHAQQRVDGLAAQLEAARVDAFRAKLGLLDRQEQDAKLIDDFLELMQQHRADLTNTFRTLGDGTQPDHPLFRSDGFQAWHARWLERLEAQAETTEHLRAHMRRHNPAIIPRNHRVEEALTQAVEHDDLAAFCRLHEALQRPYDAVPEHADLHEPAPADAAPYRTFCGT